ncbi:hypothetical protein B0H11DRAFT_2076473 [Mycena galericulata]|nr:hypothetical protein B0H11DRAFT_2076473 [Mycena galericulata]
MPASRSPHPQRRKKPPACDSCKARRVLCHPTTDGTPCPRCAEKEMRCTTTPVIRGRPPAKHLEPVVPDRRAVSDALELPSDSYFSSSSPSESVSPLPGSEPPQVLELTPELVHHLFECFKHLPQHTHPMYRGSALLHALSSLSWRISMLPAQLKVLAHCVIAVSASVSFDHAILGPGPQPASFADRSVFTRGADLSAYGVRRAAMLRLLRAEALRLACEANIFLEPSEDNAASCYLIQFLDTESPGSSRPWAVAYLSHVRALAPSWDEIRGQEYHTSLWTGYLMLETLEATLSRKPILVSLNDQHLITGLQPLSLQPLFTSLQTALRAPVKPSQEDLMFTIMQPFLFHITRLARELSENITGGAPLSAFPSRTSVAEFLSALTLLHSIRALIFDPGELDLYPTDPLFYKFNVPHTRTTNVRVCAHIMTFGRATLVLALYRELVRRAALSPSDTATGQWAAERLALLHRQTREMANFALEDVARGLRFLPSIPHLSHLARTGLVAWAQFAADEAGGGVTGERAAVLQTISAALKLVGYSWPLPPGLVEELDSYVDTHAQEHHAPPLPPSFTEDTLFMDMFPSPPLDNDWMTMFATQLGDGLAGACGENLL